MLITKINTIHLGGIIRMSQSLLEQQVNHILNK
jgi:hypothetical protein